jgi:hypothetical protein
MTNLPSCNFPNGMLGGVAVPLEIPQINQKVPGRLIAPLSILLQTLPDDALQLRRCVVIETSNGVRLAM